MYLFCQNIKIFKDYFKHLLNFSFILVLEWVIIFYVKYIKIKCYINLFLGVKAFIDKCYNIKMAEYPMRYFDGVLLNEIDL